MLELRGVGEGNIVGGGSWDRDCWPGRFVPMGLWAAAEFRCIWLGWLLLMPVGKEDKTSVSGTSWPQLGQILAYSPAKWCQGTSFHHWCPQLQGKGPCRETESSSSGSVCNRHVTGC